MSDLEFRREIVRIGRLLHDKGFIAANDGNISVRLNDFTVLATPTCMSKGMLTEEDLVTVDIRGKKLSGFREVSSEIAMHLMIYRVRPDVSAVVHAHPPTATGFAAAGRGLDEALVSEIVISLGKVPLAGYATPGTTDLCDCIEPFMEDHDAVLMANHGVVTCGDDLLTAYMNMETVEHYAKISLVAHQLGTKCPLSDEQVEGLLKIRSRIREMRSLQKNRA
jgi:L-fuculose-phosphate aldolase